MEQDPQTVVALLESWSTVHDCHVLVREVKVYLEVGDDFSKPSINIKVWRVTPLTNGDEYFFTLSHNVKTPSQAGPYRPSRTMASTEDAALKEAIDATRRFLVGAISEGHSFKDDWLVPNEDF